MHSLVNRHCAHIRKPYTLEEICEQVAGNEYNAELMLQHLMLWVTANDTRSPTAANGLADEIVAALFRNVDGERASALKIELDDGTFGGGLCRETVRDRIIKVVKTANIQ